MAGASPDTMAATVAAPLERRLGSIADVTEMTSTSGVGVDADHACNSGWTATSMAPRRDVEAAIQAARG